MIGHRCLPSGRGWAERARRSLAVMVGSSSSSQEHRSCSSAPKTCDHAPPALARSSLHAHSTTRRSSCQRSTRRAIACRREVVSPDALLQPGLPASSGSVTDHSHGLRLVTRADEGRYERVHPSAAGHSDFRSVARRDELAQGAQVRGEIQSGLIAKVERVRYAKAPHPSKPSLRKT